MSLKVLFIGGTGTISTSCVVEAVRQGMEVTVLNRNIRDNQRLPREVVRLVADAADPDAVRHTIGDQHFDTVVNWINFTPEQVERDIEIFGGRCTQYVFISSASAYQTPSSRVPITESAPLKNSYLRYSRDKIACEDLLVQAYRNQDFPMTIVRPSLTYDETLVPLDGGWTVIERMRAGKPIIVHGDGTSLWTITHARDFAVGFTGLLGKEATIGESFHITGDEAPTWDQIFRYFAQAAGVPKPHLVHVPSDVISVYDDWWGASLLGDKAHTMIFDNSKVRRLVPEFGVHPTPLLLGAREVMAWFDSHPALQITDARIDGIMDRLAERYVPSRH